ncbi:MAG: tRNA dimethylallyltransferase [candidate division TM6 bacterium GW2011_GWF2_28_16]|nr:MAG: tRNA dimethylallyltransferase [candidate division TM6 bacterium GW2011_GWF2_28_16]
MKDNNKFVIIISGPTASGKTAFADKLALKFNGEIINADMGQFYTSFNIGTAKPDWKNGAVKNHLFDILDEPKDFSVVEYKNLVLAKIKEIFNKNKTPILVGGSLFYLKSLYFLPIEFQNKKDNLNLINQDNKIYSWDLLNQIDPERATKIHKNDTYRINRALDIWYNFGIKPSQAEPVFNPEFNSLFIYLNMNKNILHERINTRTKLMFNSGWVQEVEPYINTEWEEFFKKKGFIGYYEIAQWIKNGKQENMLPELINNIVCQTRQYAKRQETFWKSFKLLLQNSNNKRFICKILEINDLEKINLESIKL